MVAGNLIGVTADGDTRLANLRQGVVIDGSARSNRVGTNGDGVAGAQERNIVSGNDDVGIKIAGGVEYRWLGDSDIQGPFASAEFRDNDALGVGIAVTAPF